MTNGKIAKLNKIGLAWKAGLRTGDEIISVDNHPVRDMLDFQFLTAEENFTLEILRRGSKHRINISNPAYKELGVDFEEELFDGLRKCSNNCIFCFLQQMPKGLRESLYVRDDDFRLSFAHGNYITLTNLTEDDMRRICEQRMSTIYVSVHTTDPDLRTRMIGNKNAGRIMEQLKRFAEAKITIRTQFVVCPGVNDGENLERSIRDLGSLYPWVASIAVVPVGLTKYRNELALIPPVNAGLAKKVVEICEEFAKEFEQSHGSKLVFASDEFYLLSDTQFPLSEDYEDYPQLENGVGICRLFLDELKEVEARLGELDSVVEKVTLITGKLAEPLVQELASVLNKSEQISCRVKSVRNDFFGETVTVAGLLTGRDVTTSLNDIEPDEKVLIPDIMLKDGKFLDDLTPEDITNHTNLKISVVQASPMGVFEYLKQKRISSKRRVNLSCA